MRLQWDERQGVWNHRKKLDRVQQRVEANDKENISALFVRENIFMASMTSLYDDVMTQKHPMAMALSLVRSNAYIWC